jgi:hypothetical protein
VERADEMIPVQCELCNQRALTDSMIAFAINKKLRIKHTACFMLRNQGKIKMGIRR